MNKIISLIFLLLFSLLSNFGISYGNERYIELPSKLILYKQIIASKNKINQLENGFKIIQLIDNFVEKEDTDINKLNLFYKAILEIKSKLKDQKKLLVVGYFQAKIGLSINIINNTKIIKDYGNGLYLKQNDYITFLEGNGNIFLKVKNDIDSFSGGEKCDFFNICSHYNIKGSYTLEQIKEKIKDKFTIKYNSNDLVIIQKSYYDDSELYVYNKNNGIKRVKLDDNNLYSGFNKIKKYNNYYVLDVFSRGSEDIIQIDIRDLSIKELFKSDGEGGYTLWMNNKSINVKYKELNKLKFYSNYIEILYIEGEYGKDGSRVKKIKKVYFD